MTTGISENPATPRTRSGNLLNQLRHDIVTAELAPGERLTLEQLRERYDVGMSPLREALFRLSTEGLLVLDEHRGFRVAPISLDDLNDITFVRIELETLALRRAIAKGDDHWEGQILAAYHELSKRPEGAADSTWEQRHRVFHTALVAACGSDILLGLRDALYDKWSRYRALCLKFGGSTRSVSAEHQGVMSATLARDSERACHLLAEHMQLSASFIVEHGKGIWFHGET